MTINKYRILIVDDHPIVCHGLGELIDRQDDMVVCGKAANAEEALRQADETHPHAAVVDISLDGVNGIELTDRLCARHPHIKVLISSMHDESLYAERALRAGAHGYINKRESTRQVVDALRHVLRGDTYLSDQMINQVVQHAMHGGDIEDNPIQRLTNRELEIFEMIGRGLTTQEIAHDLRMRPRTVETHRRHIRTKLNLENTTQLNRYAFHWVESAR